MKPRQRTAAVYGVLSLIVCASCSDPTAKLPTYDTVPALAFTDSHGTLFNLSTLKGKVWVADFIYTNCPAACPLMSSKMHRFAKQVAGDEDVRLVSISVDPARDTPAALTAFANRYGGANNQWIFLTGTDQTVHQIAFNTFHVGDVLGKIEHSTKFALVDKQMRIRGYYSSLGKDDLAALLRDTKALRKARG